MLMRPPPVLKAASAGTVKSGSPGLAATVSWLVTVGSLIVASKSNAYVAPTMGLTRTETSSPQPPRAEALNVNVVFAELTVLSITAKSPRPADNAKVVAGIVTELAVAL